MDSNKMTDKELRELRVSRELYDAWLNLMTCLNNYCRNTFDDVTNDGNVIIIKDLALATDFINNKYLNVWIKRKQQTETILSIRYDGHLLPIIECVKQVLFFNLKYKGSATKPR